MSQLIERIKECQTRYMLCFCGFTEDEHFIRYSDPKIPDMYDYNVLSLKQDLSGALLERLCMVELRKCRLEKKTFLLESEENH